MYHAVYFEGTTDTISWLHPCLSHQRNECSEQTVTHQYCQRSSSSLVTKSVRRLGPCLIRKCTDGIVSSVHQTSRSDRSQSLTKCMYIASGYTTPRGKPRWHDKKHLTFYRGLDTRVLLPALYGPPHCPQIRCVCDVDSLQEINIRIHS